jgi:hypothetical protein
MKLGSQYGCGVQSMAVSRVQQQQFLKPTELPDVHDVVLVLQDSSLVVVHVQVVWRAEDGHDTWETCRPSLSVHAVSGILGFVRPNDGEQIVLFKECACGGVREKVRASSDMVVDEEVVGLLLSKLLERVGPENITHQAVRGWFPETINLCQLAIAPTTSTLTYALQVIQCMELGAQAAVYAQELLVHNCSQGQCAE